jgi:hypothetical protein
MAQLLTSINGSIAHLNKWLNASMARWLNTWWLTIIQWLNASIAQWLSAQGLKGLTARRFSRSGAARANNIRERIFFSNK